MAASALLLDEGEEFLGDLVGVSPQQAAGPLIST
jgi:hypothetical protein